MKYFLLIFLGISQISWSLTHEEFKTLHQSLQPDSDETWRSIPWKISVIDGQNDANQQNKLIFIWAMDGHPMTCT
ncbi:MAG: hypothetical protein GWP42_09125 [Verrucomicrobiales bacterium]|jgi:hypothetical protein|nr:hypothetical protein [Verrucomicrobiales bacterium]NCG27689.1 hypothetical protein [Verrucomicrobiales bacterium]|tara:strand:- start:1471 stop:1695 length:225 start_codon:yes stop_codon:yes gene_type:complete